MKPNEQKLLDLLKNNNILMEALEKLKDWPVQEYYIGAWVISQTIRNQLYGKEIMHGISDMDIIYFDSSDVSKESEQKIGEMINKKIGNIWIEFDVVNQARVHIRYPNVFNGRIIPPYQSLEHAIDTWPTTVTCNAIRKLPDNTYKVYSTFWLDDLFSWTIRANKQLITKEIYEAKATKWKKKRPELTITPW